MRDVIVTVLLESIKNLSADDAYRAANKVVERLQVGREVITIGKEGGK
jgi:hypothetical protein